MSVRQKLHSESSGVTNCLLPAARWVVVVIFHLMLTWRVQKATDSWYLTRSMATPDPPSALPRALRIAVMGCVCVCAWTISGVCGRGSKFSAENQKPIGARLAGRMIYDIHIYMHAQHTHLHRQLVVTHLAFNADDAPGGIRLPHVRRSKVRVNDDEKRHV